MDSAKLFAFFCLTTLTYGRSLNDEHTKGNNINSNIIRTKPTNKQDAYESRSYGFKEQDNLYSRELNSDISNILEPKAATKSVSQTINEPEIDDYGEPDKLEQIKYPEKMDSSERFNESEKLENSEDDDFEQVKKVKEISSIISLIPKERNKVLDPISDQQNHTPMRIVRPMRDLSIVVRNRKYPVIIARQVPVHWIPNNNYYPQHRPKKPHLPSMPKHNKPCKPCEPKFKKKHPNKPKKPKKPKKKPKKEHCHHHHTSKKPHNKKLIYYASMPTAMNYYYRPWMQANKAIPNASYNVKDNPEDSPEHEDVETETSKPFYQEVEDDVEEHRLAELDDNFEEVIPAESKHNSSLKS